MKANPILKKELVLGARSIKLPLALLFYSACLSVTALVTLDGMTGFGQVYREIEYETLTSIFLVLAYMQLFMICVIIPVLTAGSIAGERERQTLDIMLTAPISPLSIVLGKLFSAMCNIFLFVISSLPAMAIAFLYGGIRWEYLLIFMVSIMCIAFFSGAIGIWCSSIYKKTIVSVIMTMIVELAFFLGTILILLGYYYIKYERILETGGTIPANGIDVGWVPAILLLNPAVGFTDAIYTAYTGSSGAEMILKNSFFGNAASGLVKICPWWSWISMGVTILLGIGFVMLAAGRIDSVRRREKHRNTGHKAGRSKKQKRKEQDPHESLKEIQQ
ncbi:MAG: ABC transporter permease subunit [Lachnospiraceae bacterium]|nr:ABC transporter permease subunit [Lachnospiraceae bacterium]MDY4969987.1 ABC transporter permease subunit [Lachnospiraceae bacterium]